MSLHIKQSGTVKEANDVKIKQSSIWTSVHSLWEKYSGVWKLIFPYYAIKLVGTSDGTPENNFLYEIINDVSSIVINAGDKLIYDIYVESPDTTAGIDCHLSNFDPYTILREMGITDQNGMIQHPAGDVGTFANYQWYNRIIPLDVVAGATLYNWILAFENDPAGTHVVYVKNVRIEDNTGVVRLYIFKDTFDDTVNTAYFNNFVLNEKSLVIKGN